MRRFPTATRLLCEALGAEWWPFRASWTGQRELDIDRYAEEFDLDWTVGAFMLARREALESAGWLDERLFLYSDDPDLARRIKQAGWTVRHLPQMAILHHARKMGWNPRGHAQYAYAYRQYFAKHLSPTQRARRLAALALGYGLRALLPRAPAFGAGRAARDARRAPTTLGRAGPPYEPPADRLRGRPSPEPGA